MNTKDPLPPSELRPYYTNTVPTYEGVQENPGENSLAAKFNLPISMVNELNALSDLESLSKTEIVRKALYQYFYSSHYLNNRRFFLKPQKGSIKPVTYEDLRELANGTRLSVMWCNNYDDPPEKCFFLAVRLIGLTESTVVINPSFYLMPPSEKSSSEKSDVIKPGFYEFDPNIPNNFLYLHNLKYEIDHQYIWSILPN